MIHQSELIDRHRPCHWYGWHWVLALFNPYVSHIHHHPPPPSSLPAGARDFLISSGVYFNSDIKASSEYHPHSTMFFTESFAITPTTLALLGSKVGMVCICFFIIYIVSLIAGRVKGNMLLFCISTLYMCAF